MKKILLVILMVVSAHLFAENVVDELAGKNFRLEPAPTNGRLQLWQFGEDDEFKLTYFSLRQRDGEPYVWEQPANQTAMFYRSMTNGQDTVLIISSRERPNVVYLIFRISKASGSGRYYQLRPYGSNPNQTGDFRLVELL